jgi:hypothetical protein
MAPSSDAAAAGGRRQADGDSAASLRHLSGDGRGTARRSARRFLFPRVSSSHGPGSHASVQRAFCMRSYCSSSLASSERLAEPALGLGADSCWVVLVVVVLLET